MLTIARRRRYFWLRVVYGILILFVLWASYSQARAFSGFDENATSIQSSAVLAAAFFVSFNWLQLLAILVVGPAMAAGTIATERERRTIEYLFATDLANHEIVLGKIAARLMLLGQFVLVGLPILYIFRILGGIPGNLLLTTFLLAGSTSLLLTAISVCVSVWSPRARDATIRVYLLLAALLVLPLILKGASGLSLFSTQLWQATGRPIVEFCLQINPLNVLAGAMGGSLAIGANLDMPLVFRAIGWQLLVSFAAMLLATFAVRRVHLRESSDGVKPKKTRRLELRLPKPRRELGNNPMIWKEVYAAAASTRLGIVGRIALGLILFTAVAFMLGALISAIASRYSGGREYEFHEFLALFTGMYGTGMLLLLAARAAGLVTYEKERDCWQSLLGTPLTGQEILCGKILGNFYDLRRPMLLLLAAWGLGIFMAPTFFLAALMLLATFLLAAWYVTNLGLFFSLRSQTTLRAMGATFATLVFTGGGYLFCCCAMLSASSGANRLDEIILAPCIPYLLAFPAFAYVSMAQDFFWNQEGLAIAYVLGVFGYAIVSAILYLTMTKDFDQLAGRCY